MVTQFSPRQDWKYQFLPAVCSWWCSVSHTGTRPVWRCVYLLQSALSLSGNVDCWCGYRRCTEGGQLRKNQQDFKCYTGVCCLLLEFQSSFFVMEPFQSYLGSKLSFHLSYKQQGWWTLCFVQNHPAATEISCYIESCQHHRSGWICTNLVSDVSSQQNPHCSAPCWTLDFQFVLGIVGKAVHVLHRSLLPIPTTADQTVTKRTVSSNLDFYHHWINQFGQSTHLWIQEDSRKRAGFQLR